MNGRQARTLRREARAYVLERVDSDASVAAFRASLREEMERFANERGLLVEIARLAREAVNGDPPDHMYLEQALDAWDELRSAA